MIETSTIFLSGNTQSNSNPKHTLEVCFSKVSFMRVQGRDAETSDLRRAKAILQE